ncbi:unnamed protein product [Amoebophrya sp. A25]|nr:unnamed protein product [Amoebophrya sp. A25]|eukprot:GSA25T00013710001.1
MSSHLSSQLTEGRIKEFREKVENMRTRMDLDQKKASPFVPADPDCHLLNAFKAWDHARIKEGITCVAAAAMAKDAELKSTMDPELLKLHGKYNIGFVHDACVICKHDDQEAYKVFTDGGSCIGCCGCPPSWPNHVRRRQKMCLEPLPCNIDKFGPSAPPPDDMDPLLVAEVWRQSMSETAVEPLLQHARVENPISFQAAKAAGWTYVFRRYGIAQKEKIRMIDPACACNERSHLERSVPMASAADILASATVLKHPTLRGMNVVNMTRRVVKKGRKMEVAYEKAFLDHIETGTPIPEQLLKPVHDFHEFNGFHSASSAKRRKIDYSLIISLIMLCVDAHKAYNTIGVRPSHRKYNRFCAFNGTCYMFFQALVLIFGNVHSVAAWCRVSSAIKSIIRFFVGIVVSVYVDDYPAPVPQAVGEHAMDLVLHIFRTIGLPIHPAKARLGQQLEVLGLLFDLACLYPEFFISLQRREAISRIIRSALETSSLPIKDAESLLGKVMFCLSALVDRQFNPVLKPLCNYVNEKSGVFSVPLQRCLHNILSILGRDLRRVTKFEDPRSPNTMVYTDAAFSHKCGYISVVIVRGKKIRVARCRVRADEIIKTTRRSPINFLETIAAVMALIVLQEELSGEFFRLSVDNDSAKGALLNMNSPAPELAGGALLFWAVASKQSMTPWIDRVPSGFNIADIPTRPLFMLFVEQFYPSLFDEVRDFSGEEQRLTRLALLLEGQDEFGVDHTISVEDMTLRSNEIDNMLI